MNMDQQTVDVVLYLALSEEFGMAMEVLGRRFTPVEFDDVAITAFIGTIKSRVLKRGVRIAVITAGKMGSKRSTNVVAVACTRLRPSSVVVLGIAGSLSDDLKPGDVFIPDTVTDYLADSATRGARKWRFETSGDHFQTSPRLLSKFQLFKHEFRAHYNRWLADTMKHTDSLIESSIEKNVKLVFYSAKDIVVDYQ